MRVFVVVRASEIFEPSLVGTVQLVATGEKLCRQQHENHRGHSGRNPAHGHGKTL